MVIDVKKKLNEKVVEIEAVIKVGATADKKKLDATALKRKQGELDAYQELAQAEEKRGVTEVKKQISKWLSVARSWEVSVRGTRTEEEMAFFNGRLAVFQYWEKKLRVHAC